MSLFAKVLALPRIETFVDPTTIEAAAGRVHDGAWLVEVTLDDRPIGCILDGLVRAPADHARRLEALAYRLPTVPAVAVARPGPDGTPAVLDAWMMRWPDPLEVEVGGPAIVVAYVDDAADADNLTRLCARDELQGFEVVVIVTTPASPLVTAASIAALQKRLPEVRPVVMTVEPLPVEVRGALARVGGAHLQLCGNPIAVSRSAVAWRDVELALTPGRDVELVVHADRIDRRDDSLVIARAQALHESDSVRVDALSLHVDEPVFAVEVRGMRVDLPFACTAYHVAQRGGAQPPTHEQTEAVVEANRIVEPACAVLATPLAHDRWVDGVVVFEVAGIVSRVRLQPAMRIATPTASVEVRVVHGQVHVRAGHGPCVCDGVRLANERVIAPYAPLMIDDVRAAFAVGAALPDEAPLRIIEGACTRYPHLLVIDDVPIEVRRQQRNDELWCEGSPLAIGGTIADGDHVEMVGDAIDLSWLIHAAREAPLRGRSRVPIVIAEEHGIAAMVTVDLGTRAATLAVRRVGRADALPSGA